MIIGLVAGKVQMAHKDVSLKGLTLLVVQELDLSHSPTGKSIIVADCVGAGQGDLVIICEGTPALHTDQTAGRPIDAATVGIIEKIDLD